MQPTRPRSCFPPDSAGLERRYGVGRSGGDGRCDSDVQVIAKKHFVAVVVEKTLWLEKKILSQM
jgi:hypothetical protein